MRQRPRLIVAVLALVIGLHVFMLAGLDANAELAMGHGAAPTATVAPAGGLADRVGLEHDMAATCLAVLAGMVVLGIGLRGTQRRPPPRPRPRSPVARPPTPSPIALGISWT